MRAKTSRHKEHVTIAALCLGVLTLAGLSPVRLEARESGKRPAAAEERESNAAGRNIAMIARLAPSISRSRPGERPSGQKVTVANLGGLRLRIRNTRIEGRMNLNGNVSVTSFRGEFGGGQIRVDGQLGMPRTDMQQHAKLIFDNVEVSEVLAAANLTSMGNVLAKASGTADLSWKGADTRDVMRTLNGKLQLRIGSGSVSAAPLLNKLADFSGIHDFREVHFGSGQIEAVVRNGQVKIRNCSLEGDLYRLDAQGKVDLMKQSLTADCRFNLPFALAQKSEQVAVKAMLALLTSGRAVQAADSLLDIPFSLVGKWYRPELKFSYSEVALIKNPKTAGTGLAQAADAAVPERSTTATADTKTGSEYSFASLFSVSVASKSAGKPDKKPRGKSALEMIADQVSKEQNQRNTGTSRLNGAGKSGSP